MDGLKRLLAGIWKAMGALTLSQRLLVASVGVIAGLVLIMISVFAARPVTVELSGFSPAKLAEAVPMLQGMGIKAEAKGDKLVVPAEKQYTALGLLGESGKLPDDTTLLFSNLASRQHWMNSRVENDRNALMALQNELARVIKNFKGVKDALVVIDAPEPVGLGLSYRRPTAQVTVFTAGAGVLNETKVDAITGLVAGSKAGLAAGDVRVIDGTSGRQFRSRNDEDFRAGDYLEHVAKIEERVQQKIAEALHYIPGVIVAVNAQVDIRKMTTSTTKMLPVSPTGGSVSVVSKETSDTQSTSSAGGAAEPGVRSNVADSIDRGGGGSGRESTERTETEYKVGLGTEHKETIDARGMPTKLNVMINVSREYVVALARQGAGDPKADPKPEEIQAAFDKEKERITRDVQPLVETSVSEGPMGPGTAPGTVVVSMIPVPMPADLSAGVASNQAGLLGLGGGGASGGGTSGVLGGLLGSGVIKQGLLALLAVGALGMMMVMVRKATRPAPMPSPEEMAGVPPTLQANSDLVGEADETQTAMMGIELGEEQLKSKKILEQVDELVKKNPAEAASLLNRWMAIES